MSNDQRRRQVDKGNVMFRKRELELEKKQLDVETKKVELEKRVLELEKEQFFMEMEQKQGHSMTTSAVQTDKVEKSGQIERQPPIGRNEVEKTPSEREKEEKANKRAVEIEKYRCRRRELERIERDAAVVQVDKAVKIEPTPPTGRDEVEQASAGVRGRISRPDNVPQPRPRIVYSLLLQSVEEKKKADSTCSVCRREFRCRSALKQHAFTHGRREEKPFVCQHHNCRFRSVALANVKKHDVCHSADREGKFVCRHCDSARFARGIALANHMAGSH